MGEGRKEKRGGFLCEWEGEKDNTHTHRNTSIREEDVDVSALATCCVLELPATLTC